MLPRALGGSEVAETHGTREAVLRGR
jgi:hypothetical protein